MFLVKCSDKKIVDTLKDKNIYEQDADYLKNILINYFYWLFITMYVTILPTSSIYLLKLPANVAFFPFLINGKGGNRIYTYY